MRPIVHIGYHKTATTWFQNAVYPAATSHAFVPRVEARKALVLPDAFAFDADEARRRLNPPCGRPPVLCEETLSGYLHNGGLNGHLSKAVAERIHATFPDAHVVIFIRRQTDMIAATYQQYVRGGGTYRPRRYLFPHRHLRGAFAEPDKVPRFTFAHFEYDRLIAHYDRLFGAENVHVLLYEQLGDDRAGVIDALERRTGLVIDRERLCNERRNVSLPLPLVRAARVANLFTERTVLDKRTLLNVNGWYHIRRHALESLQKTGWFGAAPAPEQLLGKSIVAHTHGYYATSNRRLAALRPELPMARFGYPMDAPAPIAPGREVVT